MFEISKPKHQGKYRYYLSGYDARGVCGTNLANDCQVYWRFRLRLSCQIFMGYREFGCIGYEARTEGFLRLWKKDFVSE